MGGISIWQLLIVAVIVVLLFVQKPGSSVPILALPIKGFKKAMSDDAKQDKTSQDADFTANPSRISKAKRKGRR